MSISPLDSVLYAGLLGDAEIAALLSGEAEIAAMIRAEAALAQVQAHLGVIPRKEGLALAAALAGACLDPAHLAQGMARDGVVAPALVTALRMQLPAELAPFLHWGATSQDIADLSLILRMRDILDIVDSRLERLIRALADRAESTRDIVCLARTRSQQAAPTLFGLKVTHWLAPLVRHRQRLSQLRPRLLVVQLGGATGTLSAMGADGPGVMDALADQLKLGRAAPWHNQRDNLTECANLLAMIAASIAKMGADFTLLAQSEIGEISFAGAGGSSTLPQKQNPVIAETLVALGRFAGTQVSALHAGMIHQNERDGAAWTLEWLAFPPLVLASGASMLRALEALEALQLDLARMMANLEATKGLVLAEAASFALAAYMPRAEATGLVKAAVATCLASGEHLFDVLAKETEASVDWAALRQPHAYLAPARTLIDRALADIIVKSA